VPWLDIEVNKYGRLECDGDDDGGGGRDHAVLELGTQLGKRWSVQLGQEDLGLLPDNGLETVRKSQVDFSSLLDSQLCVSI